MSSIRNRLRITRTEMVSTVCGFSVLLVGAVVGIPLANAATTTTVTPGSAIVLTKGDTGSRCTVAYIVNRDNNRMALTAGHCGTRGAQVFTADQHIGKVITSRTPFSLPDGEIVGPSEIPDWALIDLDDRSTVRADNAGDKITATHPGRARLNDKVCTEGSTSGFACGTVIGIANDWITTDIVRAPGDSGGPLVRTSDRAALGILGHTETPAQGQGAARSDYYALDAALSVSSTQFVA